MINDGMTEPERGGVYVEADPRRPGGHRIRRGSQQGEEGYSRTRAACRPPPAAHRLVSAGDCVLGRSAHTQPASLLLGGRFPPRAQVLLANYSRIAYFG